MKYCTNHVIGTVADISRMKKNPCPFTSLHTSVHILYLYIVFNIQRTFYKSNHW